MKQEPPERNCLKNVFAMMCIENTVRVEPRNRRWEVAHNGVTRPMMDWLCTRERAIEHAVEIAEMLLVHSDRVLLVIEGEEHLLTRRVGVRVA